MEIAAYYFPNYHVDPRNEAWHGRGWTEWELVKTARPRFEGHAQPIVPEWGYFDEADPLWAARQIDLAADHGITSFLFDWYRYEDGPYLQRALDEGFLQAPNRARLRFALMWANHDWLDIHPIGWRNRPDLLAPGRVGPDAFRGIRREVVERYFSQPNYLRLDGKPFFSIYELGTFIAGLGGLPQARAALEEFRREAMDAGHSGIHLNAVVWGVTVLPSELKIENPEQVVRELGVDSIGSYAWVHHYDPGVGGFPRGSYAAAMARNVAVWEEYAARFDAPYYPNVSMGWDSSPRTIASDTFEARGYPFTAILDGNTPEAFEQALARAREYAQHHPECAMVTLNAWNEWTEGSYLLPDTVHGCRYLEAVRRVFGS